MYGSIVVILETCDSTSWFDRDHLDSQMSLLYVHIHVYKCHYCMYIYVHVHVYRCHYCMYGCQYCVYMYMCTDATIVCKHICVHILLLLYMYMYTDATVVVHVHTCVQKSQSCLSVFL